MCILSIGNVFDGLRLIGPFDHVEAAIQYAEQNRLEEWGCVELEPPDKSPTSN